MKSEIPDPMPYFSNNSSRINTMMPATKSWNMMSVAFPNPSSATGPYIPEKTYTTAIAIVMNIPPSLLAASYSIFWSGSLRSTSSIFMPCISCISRPELTIGDMPSSISVPRFDASIAR